MAKQLPLCAQPGPFWIGVGLVAEAPFVLTLLFLPDSAKLAILEFTTSWPLGVFTSISLLVACYFLTAWVAHRLGLGE